MNELKERILEFDILRVVAVLIIIILIHFPLNYTINFYEQMDIRTGYIVNQFGALYSIGIFVFISGFTLHFNNRNINSINILIAFYKKRMVRIFPLYWLALLSIIVVYFDVYNNFDLFYLICHLVGLQLIFSPIYGPPIMTVWFIGLITIYYLIYPLFSFSSTETNEMAMLIIAKFFLAIFVFSFFIFLNKTYDLLEYRLFVYYFIFIIGIIASDLYIKFGRIKKEKHFNLIMIYLFPFLIVLNSFLTEFFLSNYAQIGYQLRFIEDLITNNYSITTIVLELIALIILSFLFILYILAYISKKFMNETLLKFSFLLGYSTFCVFLFHRAFYGILKVILEDILHFPIEIQTLLIFLSLPILFIISYLIQSLVDSIQKMTSIWMKNHRSSVKTTLEI